MYCPSVICFFFFFNDTATTEIYTLSLHDALPISARWVDSLEIGGVIVFTGSPFDIATKLNALQRRSRVPLLVSADLEWGAGMRVVGGTSFPHIMAVGATGDPHDAYTIAAAAASRSEEHTSELQSQSNIVCRLL